MSEDNSNPEKELAEYEAELAQVEEALLADPTNEDMLTLKKELVDVIAMTKDLIAATQQQEQEAASVMAAAVTSAKPEGGTMFPQAAVAAAMAQYNRTGELCVGGECEALHPKERRWYNAIIRNATRDGYLVEFSAKELPVFLGRENVRQIGAGRAAYTDKKAAASAAEIVPTEIPKWLKIKPTDSEKEKLRKKKRIKTIKNQMRVKKIDESFDKKRSSWQNFYNKKGNHHDSMFKTTSGKVGVVGSGKAMTPYATNKTKIDNTEAIRKESELEDRFNH